MDELEAFVFYPTFFKQLSRMPDAERLAMYDAIARYGCTGEDTDFSRWDMDACFDPIKVAIDNAKDRYDEAIENGRKGGKPTKFTEEQKQQMAELYTAGKTVAEIAAVFRCSQVTVYRSLTSCLSFHKGGYDNHKGGYDNHKGGYDNHKGGYDNHKGGYDLQNLKKDIDIDIKKNIDIDIESNVKNESETSQQPTSNATDFESLINKSNRLGVPVDEATAERIISYCNDNGIKDPVDWFRFCWEKTSTKGLLSGKNRDESKRIVVSAAINKNDKWGYIADDYMIWLKQKKPESWSSGIKLPEPEECISDAEVAQLLSDFNFRST